MPGAARAWPWPMPFTTQMASRAPGAWAHNAPLPAAHLARRPSRPRRRHFVRLRDWPPLGVAPQHIPALPAHIQVAVAFVTGFQIPQQVRAAYLDLVHHRLQVSRQRGVADRENIGLADFQRAAATAPSPAWSCSNGKGGNLARTLKSVQTIRPSRCMVCATTSTSASWADMACRFI